MKKLHKLTTSAMLLATIAPIGLSVANSTVAFADEIDLTTINTNEDFINTIGPKAQKIADEHGIYASVMIAQSILESGWGKSSLSQAPNYNLFGIKGSYEGQSVNLSTKEYSSNGSYNIFADFRSYNSYEESLLDNAKLISKDFYSGAWKENAETYKEATAYLTNRYATSGEYDKQLNELIELYDLTKFDKKPEVEDEELEINPDFKTKTVEDVKDISYKVKENDSLWGIARENKVSIDQITKWNENLKEENTSKLTTGLVMKVGEEVTEREVAYQTVTETEDIIHKVKKGDSVWSIGAKNDLTIEEVQELNPQLPDDNILYLDDEIKVGEETKTYDKILSDEEKEDLIKKAEDEARQKKEEETRAAESEVLGVSTTSNSDVTTTNLSIDATQAEKVIAEAQKYLGTPYVWGGRAPGGFDCSGLMQYIFRQATGREIGSWTVPQESAGATISVSEAQPGDLYFWGSPGGTTHVALAIGGGQYIHAPQPGDVVKVGSTQWFTPSFAVRVL